MNFAQPGQLFEDLGITYIGVVPGPRPARAARGDVPPGARSSTGPVIVHVRTQKGRGYRPAEADQVVVPRCGAAADDLAPATDATTGCRQRADAAATARRRRHRSRATAAAARRPARMPTGDGRRRRRPAAAARPATEAARTTPRSSSQELIELARDGPADRRRSPPGMPTGTGLNKFQAAFPDRFIDVGIAEQHAVTLATGLAIGGMRPVVALYSTFLQRAFDQTVHDVCQNDAAGPARGRPRGPRRRGRHEPPGHVHAARPSASCRTSSSPARRTSRSCARCSARRSPRTTRSRSTTRATPASASRTSSPRRSRSGGARCSARAATSCSSASGRSSHRALEVGRRARGATAGRSGVHQRAVRQAARPRS